MKAKMKLKKKRKLRDPTGVIVKSNLARPRCFSCDGQESFLLTQDILRKNPNIVAYSKYLLNTNTFKLHPHTRICLQCLRQAKQYGKVQKSIKCKETVLKNSKKRVHNLSSILKRHSVWIKAEDRQSIGNQDMCIKYLQSQERLNPPCNHYSGNTGDQNSNFNQITHKAKDMPLIFDIHQEHDSAFNQKIIEVNLHSSEDQSSFDADFHEKKYFGLDSDVTHERNSPFNPEFHEYKDIPLDLDDEICEQKFSVDQEIDKKLDFNLKQAFPVKQELVRDEERILEDKPIVPGLILEDKPIVPGLILEDKPIVPGLILEDKPIVPGLILEDEPTVPRLNLENELIEPELIIKDEPSVI